MAQARNPVIVCIPGACHGAWLYGPLAAALEKENVRTLALTLPGSAALDDDVTQDQESMYPDAELVYNIISELLDAGDDVITLCHSYAGIVAGEAVGRLARDGKVVGFNGKGSVRWMVSAAAYTVLEDTPVFDCGDRLFADLGIEKPRGFPFFVDETGPPRQFQEKHEGRFGFVLPSAEAGEWFFSDMEPAEREPWLKLMRKQSKGCFVTPMTVAPGWRSVPSTYILAEKDTVIPAPFQEALVQQAVESAGERGGLLPFSDPVVGRLSIDAGHDPMLSSPAELKDLLLKVVDRASNLG